MTVKRHSCMSQAWKAIWLMWLTCLSKYCTSLCVGSNYAVIASSKAASLLLSGVLCELLAGDAVQAEAVFRTARLKDPDVSMIICMPRLAQGICYLEGRAGESDRLLWDLRVYTGLEDARG